MPHVPEGVEAALFGAVIAAVGYVGKLLIETGVKWNANRLARRARLVDLLSLLLASKKAFEIQNELVFRLCEKIRSGHPAIDGPYDEVLAQGYPLLDEQQKLEHGLIRHYTTDCIHPLNLQTVDWLSKDDHFKGRGRTRAQRELSGKLQALFAHLMLWRAKYDFWIPNRPERAIVYLEDENRHGIGFPTGIEELIARAAGGMTIHASDRMKEPGEAMSP